jgi:YHS domain-containing protein
MRKIAIVISIIAVFIFSIMAVSVSSAEQEKGLAGAPNAETIVDVGNKLCPVTGQPVDGVSSYVYNGKKYNFCCAMCPGVFAKDPVKYSAIAEAEVGGKK